MPKLLLLLLIIFSSALSQAQEMKLEQVILLAEKSSNLDTDTIRLCQIYVLDGIPYTEVEVFEEALKTYTISDIERATIFDLFNSQLYCRICDYILAVETTHNDQKK